MYRIRLRRNENRSVVLRVNVGIDPYGRSIVFARSTTRRRGKTTAVFGYVNLKC